MGDRGLEYGNEKRVCTPFDVVLAFLVSVLIVLKFVGEYAKDGIGDYDFFLVYLQGMKILAVKNAFLRTKRYKY